MARLDRISIRLRPPGGAIRSKIVVARRVRIGIRLRRQEGAAFSKIVMARRVVRATSTSTCLPARSRFACLRVAASAKAGRRQAATGGPDTPGHDEEGKSQALSGLRVTAGATPPDAVFRGDPPRFREMVASRTGWVSRRED